MNRETVIIDNVEIPIEGEKNILELARKADIEIPTFCYHSSLSVYGACRLCLVDIDGKGIVTSCTTQPKAGMKVKTQSDTIREMRKVAVELLLAGHDQSCPTCSRSATCKLQDLARRLGIDDVRFKKVTKNLPKDTSSPALVRDPNKCVLCGDCVRVCREVQSVGAIDFTGRGRDVVVSPAYNKELGQVECVNCGQCAAVCPTGAIVPKSETDVVWKALNDESKTVVVQIAPAVRVSLGEVFGLKPGAGSTGKIVAALKRLGFDQIYDTSFAADLTVMEETTEFLKRKEKGENLPQFTSCCPAWVKFAEQYYADLLPNLSSCRSPQQMFGALAKSRLPDMLKIERDDLFVVSIMPCTAKKFERTRSEFDGDVDAVLTTRELGLMIEEAGIHFNALTPGSFDLPFGFKSGAGVIFGQSGGVSEAVLRMATEKMTGRKLERVDIHEVRGEQGYRQAEIDTGNGTVKLIIVHGLANARRVAEGIRAGEIQADLVEVMACPGGCVGGAGQPVSTDAGAVSKRAKGLLDTDKTLLLHKSQENPYVTDCYDHWLGEPGSELAHNLLHTGYQSRKRIVSDMKVTEGGGKRPLEVGVCVGTNCFVKGSQDLLHKLIRYVDDQGLAGEVQIKATFCFENCKAAPNVKVGEVLIGGCTFEKACDMLNEKIREKRESAIPVE